MKDVDTMIAAKAIAMNKKIRIGRYSLNSSVTNDLPSSNNTSDCDTGFVR